MPSQPAWFHRLDEILSALRPMTSTHLDRAAVEKLFRVHQRRARQIMAGLKGLRVGSAAAVSREALITRSAGQVNFVIGRSWIPPLVTPPIAIARPTELPTSSSAFAVELPRLSPCVFRRVALALQAYDTENFRAIHRSNPFTP